MNKVIYINYQPLTEKFVEDYFVNSCLKNQIDVEYWDITLLYSKKKEISSMLDFNYLKKIKSFKELSSLLKKNSKPGVFFITNITYEFKVWKLYFLLKFYKCQLGFFARGMLPVPDNSASSKIVKVLLDVDLVRIKEMILNKLSVFFKKINFVKKVDIIFRSGSEGLMVLGHGFLSDAQKAKIIDINYFDYDKYFISSGLKSLDGISYSVFLDEYLPYHPDVELLGINTVEPESYFLQLNNFFDYLEKKLNVIIVIAAHPKASNYLKTNPFNGRKVFFNRTCELIKDSKFAITHHSTSISFPILFSKPIFFITSKNQKKNMNELFNLTLFFGKYLNCKVFKFDQIDIDEDFSLSVDSDRYSAYKYKYLTSKESEFSVSSQVFIDTIRKL